MNAIQKAWSWVPTLYFAQGLPYAIVIVVTPAMFDSFGMSNTEIGFYSSWFYLPWMIKPFWSHLVDNIQTKRIWVVLTQFLLGAFIAMLGFSLPLDNYLKYTLVAFWLIAFSSATHDIAADGYYMHALSSHGQSFFVGIRNTAYRLALITGQGLMATLAGRLNQKTGIEIHKSWMLVVLGASILYLLLALYHAIVLPRPESDNKRNLKKATDVVMAFWESLKSFLQKPQILLSLAFVLLFRFGEAQLTRLSQPFLMDNLQNGGLGLSLETVGKLYGIIGTLGLVAGGITGGILASRQGLKYWLWPMVLMMNLPNLGYVFMAWAQPQNLATIASLITFEQFGYGFGFTAFTLYLLQYCEGRLKTSHYAIATGFMAAGMMLPGMISGWVQEQIGYTSFFVYIMLCTLPGMALIPFLKIDATFGKKQT